MCWSAVHSACGPRPESIDDKWRWASGACQCRIRHWHAPRHDPHGGTRPSPTPNLPRPVCAHISTSSCGEVLAPSHRELSVEQIADAACPVSGRPAASTGKSSRQRCGAGRSWNASNRSPALSASETAPGIGTWSGVIGCEDAVNDVTEPCVQAAQHRVANVDEGFLRFRRRG